MGSLASLHNIPYADQSSLPPLAISMGTAIEASTNTGIGIITDSVNATTTTTTTTQMVSSTSFNNISGNSNSLTSCSAVNLNNKQPSEESHNKIISKAANNRNETCVRQRNGNFISWFTKLLSCEAVNAAAVAASSKTKLGFDKECLFKQILMWFY